MTVYAKRDHKSANFFFELTLDFKFTMPFKPLPKYEAYSPYKTGDMAIFITRLHGTATLKTECLNTLNT